VTDRHPVVVVGAGPAGLAAAHELVSRGTSVEVFEHLDKVGGIARTEVYKGYRFDLGGHRFLTKVPEVQRFWADIMGPEFIRVQRLSRIYYRRRFFNYPISVSNVARNLGLWESACLAASYLRARVQPHPVEDTFEQWVTNRFGKRLYQTFFATYTQKVWGVPGSEIRADWAAQRIKGLSVGSALRQALVGDSSVKSLTREFLYPRLGVGQMWERLAERVQQQGGRVHLETPVTTFHHEGGRVTHVEVTRGGVRSVQPVSHVITSIPLSVLLERLRPLPPDAVLEAARGLRYRDFIVVSLILDVPAAFPDNWIYVHSPEVLVGRIQNFKNWSRDMVPDQRYTSLGMEYFCTIGDHIWTMTDEALCARAAREVVALGLAAPGQVIDGTVVRQPRAYPVYDEHYKARVEQIRAWLSRFENLQTIGRNGTHRYNNQDHSTMAGLMAARNVLGERHDVWAINTESAYLEEDASEA
jgi:protoporphyrinogen oxidase